MAYTPGTDTDTAFCVSKQTVIATISTYTINWTAYRITGTTVTTVVEFRGLTRAQALAMGDSADYNYDHKHGVLFLSTSNKNAVGYSWMRADNCEGDTCRADPHRVNDADMWRVTVTHTRTTVTHSAWNANKSTY